ncbi:hypothetical protein M8J75_014836 [Diaphorina citri]|nr:hypothetical protein M8J75_014836 [Diaphorina citri]KAI5718722.1 hypothetical protein M8J77_025809 [Diaphorina citri]
MNKIEMSLDDIIKNSKDIKNFNRRGRGGSRGTRGSVGGRDRIRRTSGGPSFKRSPARRSASAGGRPFTRSPRGGGGYRSVPYAKGDVDSMWTHDLYDSASYGGGRSMGGGGGGSGKLLISNLDFGVSNSDIKELFSEFGPLKSAKLHYDRSGRSLGTADLIYERRSDAIKAMKQYNGVPLDGRPMQIQLAADVSVLENTVPRPVARGGRGGASGGYRNGTAPTYRPRGGSRGAPRGGSTRGGGRGRGGRNSGPKPTQEELDAELDAYREKMDTS